MNYEMAKIILSMEEVCYDEGLGPDSTPLIKYLFKEYPRLKEDFPIIFRRTK